MKKKIKKNSFFRSAFIVSGLTLVSRFTGLFRDILISNVLGISFVADAFFMALRLPNVFRRITAEGAFSSAFIPIFLKFFSGSKNKAITFAQEVLYFLIISITAIT